MDLVEGAVAIVRICQGADDDAVVLGRACQTLRDRLGASSVSVHPITGDREILAAAGRPQRPEPPHATIESAHGADSTRGRERIWRTAPVRDEDRTIATLACSWARGTTLPGAFAAIEGLLSIGAATIAPFVLGCFDRTADSGARVDGLHLIGASPEIERVRQAIRRAAPTPFSILIEGESGSGKELVARAIHRSGAQPSGRFCALNCAALADELLEAELFGHARGAFTGAVAERLGLFEAASGGTLFLDEVGELSGRAQAKLLRTLQEGEIRRVGENAARRIDVRVIAATNRCLAVEAAEGRFRSDLLYRLDVIRIRIPPLRERVDDIGLLARHFWNETAPRAGSRAALAPATYGALARYAWPGNVRELQNVMASVAVAAPRRGRVGPELLPEPFRPAASAGRAAPLADARRGFERAFVRAALTRVAGHRGRAARELGLSRQGLAKLIARLELGVADGASTPSRWQAGPHDRSAMG